MRKGVLLAAAALVVIAPRLASAMPMAARVLEAAAPATAGAEKVQYWGYRYYWPYYQPYGYYGYYRPYGYYTYYQTYGCYYCGYNWPYYYW